GVAACALPASTDSAHSTQETAMPSLTADQIDALGERLARRRAELSAEIRSLEDERHAEPGRDPHDEVEDGGEQGEHGIREAVRTAEQERDAHELAEVVAAQERIARGAYGVCVECGEDIPRARLEAQPWAARCIGCQQVWEQSHPTAVKIPSVL